jgi:hypothetical protein
MKAGDRVKLKWGEDLYGLIVETGAARSPVNPSEVYSVVVLWDDGIISRRPDVLLEVAS